MTVLIVVLFADDDFAAGHGQINMDLIELPLTLMAVRGLDRNVAAHDVGAQVVKVMGQLPHARLEHGRRFHMAKGYL
jgi:hypothetical protein